MRHARPDYNRIQDPAGLIPEDEPVFLLRGQDPIAPQLLLEWCDRAKALGVSPHMINVVEEQAMDMADWQAKHGNHVPDMPSEEPELAE